ncbi:type II secretion system F family protein [Kitasatospora sp. NBC_00240]|uniref:type II secretion system F family protein n=1 Tax=Kitasatospora sp. NBC_00240 TaxID=2903567 RepID=UPI00224DDB4A|nr:type II secretion system F family protein [Kitasatospora sp. NBC_00240]MCX5215696.1 type II secretion system F family protein [Kitasatospora sp. NBC_00240]
MNLNPTAVIAALAGAVAVGGLCLAIAGLVGTTAPDPARPAGRLERKLRAGGFSGSGTGPAGALTNQRTLALGAVAVGLIVWLFTSWLMGGLLTGLAVFGLPWILQPGRGSKAQIQRLEALEEWVRRLSDIHTAGISLEQAVASSVRSAPKLIAPEVTRLTSRLAAGWRAEVAYRAFADELNDATADSVAAPLILHVQDRGAGLSTALKALAAQVGEEVLMRRKVEAEREKPRTNMRWVSLFCLAVFALAMLSGAYVKPYSSLTGQVVLTLLAAGFIGVMVWMRRMAIADPAPRFLAPATDRPDSGEAL